MTSIIAPILVALVLASQPPTPGSREKTQTPQSQTKAQGKDTAKAPPTTTTPVVRSETPAPSPPAPQPSGNTNNQLNHPATERGADIPSVINAISTVFIAVLTGVLAYIAWLQRKITEQQRGIMDTQRELMDRQNQIMDAQSGIMTSQLKSAEVTALAAQQSADVARDALHLTQAADVHIVGIVLNPPSPLTIKTAFAILLKNFGQTKALSVQQNFNLGLPITPITEENSQFSKGMTFGAGQVHEVWIGSIEGGSPSPDAVLAAIMTGATKLTFWGDVKYVDIFGKPYTFRAKGTYVVADGNFNVDSYEQID